LYPHPPPPKNCFQIINHLYIIIRDEEKADDDDLDEYLDLEGEYESEGEEEEENEIDNEVDEAIDGLFHLLENDTRTNLEPLSINDVLLWKQGAGSQLKMPLRGRGGVGDSRANKYKKLAASKSLKKVANLNGQKRGI
jgi:hypothetical protein